jgi:DNA-binding response OmpR family regulator
MMDQEAMARPKKILAADDNKVILKALTMVLQSNGYEVITATDGSAVVKVVDKEKPDLILLDILFPPDINEGGMSWDGFAIMRWLRNMSGAKDVPIIIISGTDPEKYRERCLAAGAAAFLHKPLNMEELIATIHAALGENVTKAA